LSRARLRRSNHSRRYASAAAAAAAAADMLLLRLWLPTGLLLGTGRYTSRSVLIEGRCRMPV
jgi:hypothetical protein